MKRMMLMLTVVAMMAVIMVAGAAPAFATPSELISNKGQLMSAFTRDIEGGIPNEPFAENKGQQVSDAATFLIPPNPVFPPHTY